MCPVIVGPTEVSHHYDLSTAIPKSTHTVILRMQKRRHISKTFTYDESFVSRKNYNRRQSAARSKPFNHNVFYVQLKFATADFSTDGDIFIRGTGLGLIQVGAY